MSNNNKDLPSRDKASQSANSARNIRADTALEVKLFDSELKVMDILWREGDITAKRVSDILKEEIGWNMNTTYTVIKKCIAKNAIERIEPNFMCRALISKEDVQQAETDELIGKLYDGSVDKLFAALLGRKKLSEKQIAELKQIVGELGEIGKISNSGG